MTFREAVQTIYNTEGSKGFTRGLTASVIRNSIMTGQYFSTLFYCELVLSKMRVFSDVQVQMLAGSTTKTI